MGAEGALFDGDEGDRAFQRALEIAYAYVNRRERTAQELRAQLEKRGVSPSLRERVLTELTETRLIDDERFATLFVSDKRELEQWGSDRIRRGLIARGIDRDLAEAALAAGPQTPAAPGAIEAPEAESELDRALALLQRRFPQPPEDRRERERALGVLLRKGYESELALEALSAYGRGDL